MEFESFLEKVATETVTNSKELKIISNGKKVTKENYEEMVQVSGKFLQNFVFFCVTKILIFLFLTEIKICDQHFDYC